MISTLIVSYTHVQACMQVNVDAVTIGCPDSWPCIFKNASFTCRTTNWRQLNLTFHRGPIVFIILFLQYRLSIQNEIYFIFL